MVAVMPAGMAGAEEVADASPVERERLHQVIDGDKLRVPIQLRTIIFRRWTIVRLGKLKIGVLLGMSPSTGLDSLSTVCLLK